MERRGRGSKGGAPAPKVVAVLAGMLERAAARGDAEGEGAATAFRGRTKPEIGVRRYAERIYRYAGCSPACFVVAYVYLDRLARRPELEEEEETAAVAAVSVDSYSVHRLLITSVMVAAKFMDDIHYNNAYFARVGGVEVSEMNGLELDLLFALRFRLNVTLDTFASYCAALEADMPPTPSPPPSPSPADDDQYICHGTHQHGARKADGDVVVATSKTAMMITAAAQRVALQITQ